MSCANMEAPNVDLNVNISYYMGTTNEFRAHREPHWAPDMVMFAQFCVYALWLQLTEV